MKRLLCILLLLALTATVCACKDGKSEKFTAYDRDDWSAIYRP